MSSDAAYFPNALTGIADERESADSKPQAIISVPSEHNARNLVADAPSETIAEVDKASDEDLLEQIHGGSRDALAILFRRCARTVRAIAYRILHDASEADDLVQEVFLFIFRKAKLFDRTKGSARSWMVQVTYHRAFDRHRHLVSRHFYHGLELDAPAAAALRTEIAFYEQSLEGTVGKETLARIEESLSDDQHQTLRLYFFEGYTIDEIAQETGQSPGNVRHHYYRALEKMRKLIFPPNLAAK